MTDLGQHASKVLDIELRPEDIQSLNGPEAVTAFFARLGYNTGIRTSLTPGSLGITAESTIRPIKKIELITNQENLFHVYLFELNSVTVTHTRALSKIFRNRAGNYLLVLTSDYERIDFVLVEKYLPVNGNGSAFAQKQVGVRPRFLTVERRKPSQIHLRVLRRFTWTESDPLAQYDKLLSAYAVADWSEEFFNNRALFSDYYLRERLPSFPVWAEYPKPSYLSLRELYHGAAARFACKEEDFLRRELLEPVLKLLGFEPNPGKGSESSAAEPDYRLYSAKKEFSPLALCLVYPWGRSLDGKDDQRDKETPEENPGAIVVSLLEKGETSWIVVTNGKLWRLYAQRTHSRSTNYYEIDLEEVLAQTGPQATDPAEAFRYFWLLFRCNSFEQQESMREGEKVSLSLLDRLLLESDDYAKKLGERLKERVFEDIFPHLAKGFITYIQERDGLHADLSQQALDAIFQGTLTLLYRLLFVLYAEARDLLPVKEVRGYFEASLEKLKREMAEVAGSIEDEVEEKLKKHYRQDRHDLYDRLVILFRIVDKGDPALNVPVYNGGLFFSDHEEWDVSPEARATRFLNATKVPDRFLAHALDLLARDIDPKRHDLVFIDYKSLGVRQLGSIYEGLLEFKLRVAPEKMAVVKGKKTDEIVPYREAKHEGRVIIKEDRSRDAKERVLPKGAVYLENDKRERKATGSYYTPDHIVKYIVERAVGPVLEEKFNSIRPKLREVQQKRQAFFQKQNALRKQGIKPEPASKADLIGQELVNELFDIKVLDPAMGSGHFLVEAVDYITDKAIDFLNSFPWNPVFAHLARMREAILQEMDDQGITIDAKRLTDVNLLKRHVLKRCIYGVDLNPMAVELAKVSLWLDCFTLGAPLSFLDHHLRCGNSLIGVTVKEVQEAVEPVDRITGNSKVAVSVTEWKISESKREQFTLFGSRFAGLLLATDLMRRVGELSDVTSAQVRESRAEYRKASDALAPFKRILDVYTSQWFGNGLQKQGRGKQKPTKEGPALTFLKAREVEPFINSGEEKTLKKALEAIPSQDRVVAETALWAASEKRFFHWELEFPEVFYGPRPGTTQAIERLEEAGFDAVIGNPPWGAEVPSVEKFWCKSRYQTVFIGVIDNFALFIERFTEATRINGYIGILLPDIVLLKNYPSARSFMLSNHRIIEVIHWGQPFSEVNLDVCSVVSEQRKNVSDDTTIRCIVDVISLEKNEYTENLVTHGDFRKNDSYKFNLYLNENLRRIISAINKGSVPLSKFLQFHEGIHSGNIREKLFINENRGKRCRPLIFGRDEVQPFSLKWAGRYVNYDRNIIDRAAGEYANLGYEDYFTKPKLLVRRTGDRIIAVTDRQGFYASNNLFIGQLRDNVALPLEFFEGLLNSRFSTWYFRSIQPRKGRLFSELKIVHLGVVPVPLVAIEKYADRVVELVNMLRSHLSDISGKCEIVIEEFLTEIDHIFGEAAGLRSDEIRRLFA